MHTRNGKGVYAGVFLDRCLRECLCGGPLLDCHAPGTVNDGNLPTRLCLRNKNLRCFRVRLHTLARTAKYQVNTLRSFIGTSLKYMTLVIQEKMMLI